MKLSIAICTHNEGDYIFNLLKHLYEWLWSPTTRNDQHKYEIVVVDDFSDDPNTIQALNYFYDSTGRSGVNIFQHALDNNFAAHKNFMNSCCTGDWILNLDADETIPDSLLDALPLLIESNPAIEAYWLPRINTVNGLTLKHVQKWYWIITRMDGFRTMSDDISEGELELLKAYNLLVENDNGIVTYDKPIINWPDPQMRLYKNDPNIKWEGKVHERLSGFKHFSMFPTDPDYAIRHHKEIERQESQNNYYETIK